MASSSLVPVRGLTIADIAEYHSDADASLRAYFSSLAPNFPVRFFGYTASELRTELDSRLEETDLRSALAVLARLEGVFRVDYEQRCKRRKRDQISKDFRDIFKHHKSIKTHVRLDEEIFEVWKQYSFSTPSLIGELRGAFKLRHWLEHGRYWTPKFGRRYDYTGVYTLGTVTLQHFPFYSG
jgi:hypothetical protein